MRAGAAILVGILALVASAHAQNKEAGVAEAAAPPTIVVTGLECNAGANGLYTLQRATGINGRTHYALEDGTWHLFWVPFFGSGGSKWVISSSASCGVLDGADGEVMSEYFRDTDVRQLLSYFSAEAMCFWLDTVAAALDAPDEGPPVGPAVWTELCHAIDLDVDCVDDPNSLLGSVNTCDSLLELLTGSYGLGQVAACETDMRWLDEQEHAPGGPAYTGAPWVSRVPVGSLLKGFCPLSCEMCASQLDGSVTQNAHLTLLPQLFSSAEWCASALTSLAPSLLETCCQGESDLLACAAGTQLPATCGPDCAHIWKQYTDRCADAPLDLGNGALETFFVEQCGPAVPGLSVLREDITLESPTGDAAHGWIVDQAEFVFPAEAGLRYNVLLRVDADANQQICAENWVDEEILAGRELEGGMSEPCESWIALTPGIRRVNLPDGGQAWNCDATILAPGQEGEHGCDHSCGYTCANEVSVTTLFVLPPGATGNDQAAHSDVYPTADKGFGFTAS